MTRIESSREWQDQLLCRVRFLRGVQQPESADDTKVERFIFVLLVRLQVAGGEGGKRDSKVMKNEIPRLLVVER